MIGGISTADPFRFNELPSAFPGWARTNGKSEVSSYISDLGNTKTIIIGGQSNMATACGSGAYTTVSSNAQNLSIYDGGIYAGSDPVLGAAYDTTSSVSSVCMRIADSMISRGKATRCIVVPIASVGTTYDQWSPSPASGLSLFGRLTTGILRCRARGLEPDAIFWGQGETDNTSGTSSASITASIRAIVDAIRASPIYCNAPFYVGLYTMNGGVTSATIRTGITNSVEGGTRKIVLGYDADTNLTVAGGFRNVDDTHKSNTGLSTSATGWTTLAYP